MRDAGPPPSAMDSPPPPPSPSAASSFAQMFGRARSPSGMIPKLFAPGGPTFSSAASAFGGSDITRVDTPGAPANDARPFAGIALCIAGLNKVLEQQATAMGAAVAPEVGADTTHVLAESATDESFTRGAARGLPIMHPAWVRDAHAAWARGQDVDPTETMSTHRLLARLQHEISGREAHIAGTLAVQERLTREDAALANREQLLREEITELAVQRAALAADAAAAEEHIGRIRADRDALKVRAYDVREALEAPGADTT